jgi:phosphoribosylaminoimidazolecarboxamide formyltransferase/IMP cyclohydrolase
VRYIEGDITAAEMPFWLECFEAAPAPLSWEDKLAFMKQLDGVALSSDAFFPFRCLLKYSVLVAVASRLSFST